MGSHLPPQRLRPGGIAGASNQQRPSLSPAQGAQEAAKRLGLSCFYAGQQVPGLVGCVACQFQIRNRGALPACPDCGELVWAWLDSTPPPDIEGAGTPVAPDASAAGTPDTTSDEAPKVVIQENVSIEPT